MSWTLLTTGLLVLYCAIVAAGAAQDVFTRKISNVLSVSLLVVAVAGLAVNWGPLWWEHLLAFAITLCFGIVLFSLGWMGGGDAKLFAAAALAFTMAGLVRFVPMVLIIGGVLGLFSILLRLFGPARRRRPGAPRQGVPYGVAIAIGAVTATLLFRPLTVFAEPEAPTRLSPQWWQSVER